MSAPSVQPRRATAEADPTLFNDWHAVAFSSELGHAAPLATKLLGEDVVLWRSSDGVHAWEDRCPHRGVPLSRGQIGGDCLACPYHGWRYDRAGDCVHVPSAPDLPPPRARVRVFPANERNGLIWASLGRPGHGVPDFPEWSDAAFATFQAGPYQYAGNAFRTVENFFDTAHLPFVHPNLNGMPAAPDRLPEIEVCESEEGLTTSGVTVFQPFGDPRQIPVHATYRYLALRPTTAGFRKSVKLAEPHAAARGRDGDLFCTYITVQPTDEESCVVRVSLAHNFREAVTADDVRRRTDLVFEQDREIVELQRPKKLPLDLAAEMHVRADRLAVAYRRWLRKLNVTYGTI